VGQEVELGAEAEEAARGVVAVPEVVAAGAEVEKVAAAGRLRR
jgi:hypothetical protein